MTLTEELIELIERRTIGEEDIRAASWFMLDGLANIIAGRNSPQGRILNSWHEAESSDASRGALWLGGLMHILEVDDLHRESVVHPGCVVIPAAIAVGLREDVSGLKMFETILKGFEACTRVGMSVGPAHYRNWHNTSTCGTFGAAYAVANLLGLNTTQLRDALGNAGTQSSGFWEFIQTGAMSKHLHAGRAGQSGVIAADLSSRGFSGPPSILEGKRGLYASCCPDANPENLLAQPDGPWQLHLTSIKPWPCCRHTHPVIDAALELALDLNTHDLEEIRVSVTQAALDVCDRPRPHTVYDAKFSLQHCVATALIDSEIGFSSFDAASRERTRTVSDKVILELSKTHENRYPEAWGCIVRLGMKDGTLVTTSRNHAKGDPDSPLSENELREKALMLFRHGGLPDPGSLIEQVLRLPAEPSLCKSVLPKLVRFCETTTTTADHA